MDPDDVDHFRKSMGGVRPLDKKVVAPERRRPRPVPRQRLRDEVAVMEELRSGELDFTSLESGDELLFLRPGLQRNVLRRLRRGEYSVVAELDLHGHTVAEARSALHLFLCEMASGRRLCVRIVHGKGLRSPGKRPVLRSKVAHWLRRRDAVLAYCSAPPADGGFGALYVLLKPK